MRQATEQGDELSLPLGIGLEKDGRQLRSRRGQFDAEHPCRAVERLAAGNNPGQTRFGGSEVKPILQQAAGRGGEIVQVPEYRGAGGLVVTRILELPAPSPQRQAVASGGSETFPGAFGMPS
jgi:hypothetical protein